MKGFTVLELLIATLIVVFLVGGIWLSVVSATHKANVWNRCHPSVPITATEAWFIADLQLDECETNPD